MPTGAGLILIELGSADLCADTNMTPVDQFRSRIDQALTTITQRAPNAKIQIASIPNWHQVWVDFPNEPRTSTCPLLFDPTVADDAAVQQRTIDYNTELAAACAAFPACKFDGGAVYDLHFSLDDLSTVDHFHPSRSGQAKIAAATFDSGWFASDAAPAARQFGYTTPGSSSGAPGEGVKFGTISTLSDDAAISDFGFYVTGSSTQQSFVPAIYSVDASGNPDALLVTGDPIVVPAGAPAEWVRGPLPATTLAAGQYMLALLAGPTAGGASIAFDAVSGAGFFNANPYPTPSDPWGSLNPVDQKLSLFVDYTLADTAPPVITVPSAITQEATGPTGAIVNYSVTATDAVDGAEPVSCDHVSGAAFTLGDTTVVCTASDAAGNTASASFGVTVRDTTPPTLTGVPTDQTMQASSAARRAGDVRDAHGAGCRRRHARCYLRAFIRLDLPRRHDHCDVHGSRYPGQYRDSQLRRHRTRPRCSESWRWWWRRRRRWVGAELQGVDQRCLGWAFGREHRRLERRDQQSGLERGFGDAASVALGASVRIGSGRPRVRLQRRRRERDVLPGLLQLGSERDRADQRPDHVAARIRDGLTDLGANRHL